MINHVFKLEADGFSLSKKFSFGKISHRFQNIEITEISDDNLEVTVSMDENIPIEISLNQADQQVNELVDRLCMIEHHTVTGINYLGFRPSDSDELSFDSGNVVVKTEMPLIIKEPLEFYGNVENSHILNLDCDPHICHSYRKTLELPDKISQFLIFYGLLSSILKGQKAVDDLIIKNFPDIETFKSRESDNETKITKDRNIIMHRSKHLDLKELSKSCDDHVKKLRLLLRNVIIG